MTPRLPGARADLIEGAGPTSQPFYRWFLAIEQAALGAATPADVSQVEAQIAALQAEIAALPHGTGYPTLQVQAPITQSGLLQNGFAQIGWGGTTDDVPEGTTNLYYTDARADARIAAHDTFPFFASDGSAAYIHLTSDLKLPFFANDGSAQNIPLAA